MKTYSWNYRVVQLENNKTGLFECGYDAQNKLVFMVDEPIRFDAKDAVELQKLYNLAAEAFEQPVLNMLELKDKITVIPEFKAVEKQQEKKPKLAVTIFEILVAFLLTISILYYIQ